MAAAWSFSKREKTDSVRRVVYGTSLDGYQLRARLCLSFDPPVDRRQADAVVADCARAAKRVLDEQISEGKLPLTRDELGSRVRTASSLALAKGAELTVDAIDVVDERGERVAYSQAPRLGSTSPAARAPARSTVPPPRVSSVPPPRVSSVPPTRVSSVPPTLASPSSPGRSGVMPAVSDEQQEAARPSAAAATTLWPRALARSKSELQPAEVGRLLAAAFRDTVAVCIYSTLIVCESTQTDRLSFLEGSAPQVIVDGLRRETTAYVAVLFYNVLLRASVPQNIAVEILQAMASRGMPAVGLPVKDVSRYMASGPPHEEFSRRVAALLGRAAQGPAVRRQLEGLLDALPEEMQACARDVRRLVGLV